MKLGFSSDFFSESILGIAATFALIIWTGHGRLRKPVLIAPCMSSMTAITAHNPEVFKAVFFPTTIGGRLSALVIKLKQM